ncbi:MAG: hypothetical protein IPP07_08860 [Holophagales bacterium]|nr:hypothetical protein [Holophagales bacterium]
MAHLFFQGPADEDHGTDGLRFHSRRAGGAEADGEQERRLEKSWREALDLDAARQLDRAERGRRAESLFATIEDVPPGEERVKIALGALGLWPQNDTYLLAVYESFLNRSSIPGRQFERFLRTLFAEESRSGDGEGRRWQLGLRNLHYFRQ